MVFTSLKRAESNVLGEDRYPALRGVLLIWKMLVVLQALATMNDVPYVEASRHFARRMLLEGGTTYPDRLTHGFRLATGRQPSPAELDVLVALFQEHHAHYQSKPDEAVKLLSIGESKRDESLNPSEYAAMTMLGNLLLNLDETLTKE